MSDVIDECHAKFKLREKRKKGLTITYSHSSIIVYLCQT